MWSEFIESHAAPHIPIPHIHTCTHTDRHTHKHTNHWSNLHTFESAKCARHLPSISFPTLNKAFLFHIESAHTVSTLFVIKPSSSKSIFSLCILWQSRCEQQACCQETGSVALHILWVRSSLHWGKNKMKKEKENNNEQPISARASAVIAGVWSRREGEREMEWKRTKKTVCIDVLRWKSRGIEAEKFVFSCAEGWREREKERVYACFLCCMSLVSQGYIRYCCTSSCIIPPRANASFPLS